MGAQVRSIHGLSMPQSSSSSTLLVLSIPALKDHCQVHTLHLQCIYIYIYLHCFVFSPILKSQQSLHLLTSQQCKIDPISKFKMGAKFSPSPGSRNDMATWQRSLSSKRGRPWPSTSMFGGQPMPLTSIPAIKMLPPGARGV